MDAQMPKLDRKRLRAELMLEFEKVVQEVSDAVDDAPAGRIIADSEEPVRDTLDRFRERVYERVLQQKINAAEAAFSPSEERGDRQAKTS